MDNLFTTYGIKEIADVVFYDIETDKPVLFLDTLKLFTTESAAEQVESNGGKGNPIRIIWDFSREINISLQDALFSPANLALVLGVPMSDIGYKMAEVERTTTYTLHFDGSLPAKITPKNGNFGASEEVPITWYDLETREEVTEGIGGRTYVGRYKFQANSSIIRINSGTFPKTYRVTGETYRRNQVSGKDELFQLNFPKVKITPDTLIELQADGDPSIFSMEMRVMRPKNGNMVELIQMVDESEDSGIYGITWDRVTGDNLRRIGTTTNMAVEPGVDQTPGVDSYANTSLFNWSEVTDELGNVFVKIPKIYLRKQFTDTTVTYSAATRPFHYCYLPKCFWDFENEKELDYVLVGKYKGSVSSDGLRLESKPDVFPAYNKTIVAFRDLAQANNEDGRKGYQQMDIHVIDLLQTLFVIHTATLDSQSKCAGFTNGSYSAAHATVVGETSVNRIIIANAFANTYEVGQTIGIGTSLGGNQILTDRLITSIEVYDASNKSIYFDGAAANIAVGNIVYNTGYKNGFSSGIASKFGSKGSNSSGKHPFVWQGIESLYGDIWQFVDGVNINENQAWVCDNAANYASNVFANPYKQLSYVNVATNNYVKIFGYDPSCPYALFPIEVSNNTSSPYKDYFYRADGQRIARFGGHWYSGSPAGLFSWNLYTASSYASLVVGARLLRKALT